MPRHVEGTITEKELAKSLGLDEEIVVAVFHGILDHMRRPEVSRLIIQGFGVFRKTIEEVKEVDSSILGRKVRRGGYPLVRLRLMQRTRVWLKKASMATVASGLQLRTGIIPELLNRNSAIRAKLRAELGEDRP